MAFVGPKLLARTGTAVVKVAAAGRLHVPPDNPNSAVAHGRFCLAEVKLFRSNGY